MAPWWWLHSSEKKAHKVSATELFKLISIHEGRKSFLSLPLSIYLVQELYLSSAMLHCCNCFSSCECVMFVRCALCWKLCNILFLFTLSLSFLPALPSPYISCDGGSGGGKKFQIKFYVMFHCFSTLFPVYMLIHVLKYCEKGEKEGQCTNLISTYGERKETAAVHRWEVEKIIKFNHNFHVIMIR